jgi:hypothetical protein
VSVSGVIDRALCHVSCLLRQTGLSGGRHSAGRRPLTASVSSIVRMHVHGEMVTEPGVRTSVTEPTNYTKLSKKIIHQTDDLANLSPYNPVVHKITTDFKPTYISAKIVLSLAVTITNYIKVHIADTSEFKHSYYKPSSNKNSGSIYFKPHTLTQSSK